ncbi:hypothetical protein EV192_107239 [Actinocrispum wychmicini]|uniref:PH (Pleckstrin Homology) domain-containing protein n=2 Tax=Actinocrispum wychmicini TaxID=1213861 RepID=A0A4R2JFZ0_9PSEU|nr:hypothetical protein EV192_107239 [Actinocrispum wychmicini]
MCLIVLWMIFFTPQHLGFWYVAQVVPALWLVLWFCWLATVHTKLELSESGLGITNWFYRYQVPWRAIHWIQSGDLTVVHTVDGRRIKPAVGGYSLAGKLRGNPMQDRISDQIAEFRKAVPDDVGTSVQVSGRLDIHPLPFLAALAGFVLLTAIVRG